MTYDLAIVGGGVVGMGAAYRAASVGASVVVFDRLDQGRATDAGAGIVAPADNISSPEPAYELAVAAAQAYPGLITELGRVAPGVDTGYERVGSMTVAVEPAEQAQFDQFAEIVLARQERHGHPTGHHIGPIDGDEARRRYPVLGPVIGAIYDEGGARVDGRRLAQALWGAAVGLGAEMRRESVESLAALERGGANAIVVAGGAWSNRFADELDLALAVEPQRGQIVHLQMPSSVGDTGGWPMLGALNRQYQVSWPGGRLAVGATRETGSGFMPFNTVAGVGSVLDEAVRAAPGLAEAEIIEIRVGLRPLSLDGMPVLGRVPDHPNIVLATGHGATGLTTGAYSGRLAADLALGQQPGFDISPFAVDRF